MQTSQSGILVLNKKSGITSFDCIRELKRIWNRTDFGHGGTLDSFATGVLPILTGEALKLSRFFLEKYPLLSTYWKTYEGIIQLGSSTQSGDLTTDVVRTAGVPLLQPEEIQEKMSQFARMAYLQTPPAYSAKKIQGIRASELARSGKDVTLTPIECSIKEFSLLSYDLNLRQIRFRALCSKGTYMRVLAEDLALRLGTFAHLISLTRTQVGPFSIQDSFTLEQCAQLGPQSTLLPMIKSVSFLEQFELLEPEVHFLQKGKTDSVAARLSNSGLSPNVYCATHKDTPVALFELTQERHGRFMRSFLF
ncbi:MAG: tRNA pseudouridine(55) synthase TruB [Bacteriovoracia bacterium]